MKFQVNNKCSSQDIAAGEVHNTHMFPPESLASQVGQVPTIFEQKKKQRKNKRKQKGKKQTNTKK